MPRETLSPTEVRDMLLQVADKIIESEPILTDADRNLGDGDHGQGMERGMLAVKEELAGKEYETVGQPLIAMGKAMMSSMGGASGVVFGILFKSAGRAVKEDTSLTPAGLANAIKAGSDDVQSKGGAKPGDKTMADALVPAADQAQAASGSSLAEVVTAGAAGAEEGKEASKDMIATMGRAKTMGEKCLGFPDAGAVSVCIILETMRDYIGAA